jgi:hypothetical protein
VIEEFTGMGCDSRRITSKREGIRAMESIRNLHVTQSVMREFITRVPVRVVIAIIMVAAIVVGSWALFPRQQVRAGSPVYTALLLIHGYQDSCSGAFDTTDSMNGTPNNTTTVKFLTSQGWGSSWDPLVKVGYYTDGSNGTAQHESGCNDNVYDDEHSSHCTTVNSNESNITYGWLADPIRHIACEMAWYIYDTYTSQHIPVYVLAHSMGGLIIRDAIGESGKSSGFPSALDVQRVVTVATPHGGVCCFYYQAARDFLGDSNELEDMLPGSSQSTFMKAIAGIQSPQGAFGTFWYLMAASDECGNTGSEAISCGAYDSHLNDPYPDGDGIVQASSALAMSGTSEKVLYGHIETVGTLGGYVADDQTQYAHETNTCWSFSVGSFSYSGCLGSPNYLNDGTLGGQTTKAWICHAPNCTDATLNFNDMNITESASANPRSLQQVSDWLSTPPPPTPTPTATPKPTPCKTQPNDTTCDNQDYIQQGCNAYPQSQVYNSSILNVTLYYSTNCQSNWTSGKIQSSGYTIVQEDIEREATLQEPAKTLTETVNNTSWYTNMLWAPNSPARGCAWYKNSSGTVSGPFCTPWSPISASCKNSPSDANCDNQDYVVQGCNDYPQTSPPPVDNGYVTITVHYSTNCQSNWAVAKLDQQSSYYIIDSVTINRAAVSGGDGAASYSSTNSNNNSSWWSPMVWAPSNPVQGCVQWTNMQSYHTYTTCTNTQ